MPCRGRTDKRRMAPLSFVSGGLEWEKWRERAPVTHEHKSDAVTLPGARSVRLGIFAFVPMAIGMHEELEGAAAARAPYPQSARPAVARAAQCA